MTWLHWRSVVDFVVLAVTLYFLLAWARETRALRIMLGIIGLHALARVAHYFDLTISSWVLEGLSVVLLLLLLVVFQSEFRHALMRLDSKLRLGLYPPDALKSGYHGISEAAFSMAGERIGALIVIARQDSVRELISDGITLGADISTEILEAIFRKNSPIHDGAVVVEAGRIFRAGAVLPLTQRTDVPWHFGTRHRAAMGMAERCDALVIAVSEERGEVTLMDGRRIITLPGPEELFRLLEGLQARRRQRFAGRLRRLLFSNVRLKLASAGLASLIWVVTFLAVGTTVRTVGVPVEFANVPDGLAISNQSVTRVEVQLRGSPWVMDSLSLNGLVARLDLNKAGTGWRSLAVGPSAFDLPPGVVMDQVSPPDVRIRIVRQHQQ